jgi:hypothetical protein
MTRTLTGQARGPFPAYLRAIPAEDLAVMLAEVQHEEAARVNAAAAAEESRRRVAARVADPGPEVGPGSAGRDADTAGLLAGIRSRARVGAQ